MKEGVGKLFGGEYALAFQFQSAIAMEICENGDK